MSDNHCANRLAHAASPYLQQHAHNPVDWYEWGDEAFTQAREKNLPVFLSIGYSTCHWCHVMAHESFEDGDVAAIMNRNFICIKVDREERPDIDDIYMTVSQVMTGSGGWPLNLFLTPDKQPIMSITYLPKRSRNGMTGFIELLGNIAAVWRQRPDLIRSNCAKIMATLKQETRQSKTLSIPLQHLTDRALQQLSASFDPIYGGFGSHHKFPLPINLSWLIGQASRGNGQAWGMVATTLDHLNRGGIWDQLAGGLHRYAVDREWRVPHFEKMLYDQAMMTLVVLEAYQYSGDNRYRRMATRIMDWVITDMTAPNGCFYAAYDADSDGAEGLFYVWDRKEIEKYCTPEDGELFSAYYGVMVSGNFEGHSVLYCPESFEEFCTTRDLDPELTGTRLQRIEAELLAVRNQRVKPFRDDKVIGFWNGLMIAALAQGGCITGNKGAVHAAIQAAQALSTALERADGRLMRCYLTNQSQVPAFLEDYAGIIYGFLELYEATLDTRWLEQALARADQALSLFCQADGTFSNGGHDGEQLPFTASLEHDGVTPSPYSLMAKNLVHLSRLTDRDDLTSAARQILETITAELEKHPTMHLGVLQAWALLEEEPCEVLVRGKISDRAVGELLQAVKSCYQPNAVIRFTPADEPATVAVCCNGVCHAPVHTAEQVQALFSRMLH